MTRAEPPQGSLISYCVSLLQAVGRTLDGSPASERFSREFKVLAERQLPRNGAGVPDPYFDQVYREWLTLGDPEHHLTVLRYPVPEVALEALALALTHQMDAKSIDKLFSGSRSRVSHQSVLAWVKKALTLSSLDEGARLSRLVTAYRNTRVIVKDGVRYLSGVPFIPSPKPDHVRLYKGSNFYKGPAISSSQVGRPLEEVLDGGEHFLHQAEANIHSVRAEAFHPDGVSVSTDRSVSIGYGSHIRIYDVPDEVVARLPRGALELSEYVFRYSVPERFRVMTLPRATFLEAFKIQTLGSQSNSLLSLAEQSGAELVRELGLDRNLILLRGRSSLLEALYLHRTGDLGGHSIERHTLQGFAQFEKYSPRFPWNRIPAPPNVHLKRTLNMAYALHDTGKPFAGEMRVPHEELSAEILAQVMNRAGFTKAEVDLARALVGNDVIGSTLQGKLTPQEAFEKLVEIAKKTNLSPRDFFSLQSFFYTMDASSYVDLAALFTREFTPNGEMLVPRGEKFQVLRNLFENAIFEEWGRAP